jgi:hypothetical protein
MMRKALPTRVTRNKAQQMIPRLIDEAVLGELVLGESVARRLEKRTAPD